MKNNVLCFSISQLIFPLATDFYCVSALMHTAVGYFNLAKWTSTQARAAAGLDSSLKQYFMLTFTFSPSP